MLKFLDDDIGKSRELPRLPPIDETRGFPPPPKPLGLAAEIPFPKPPEPPKELPPLFEEKVPEELPDFPEFEHKELLLPEIPQPKEIEVKEEAPLMKMEKPEIPRHEKGPIFVEVNDFKKMLEEVTHIKNELKSGDTSAEKTLDIKNEQDRKFTKFKSIVEDLERKILYVDKTLFETKYV